MKEIRTINGLEILIEAVGTKTELDNIVVHQLSTIIKNYLNGINKEEDIDYKVEGLRIYRGEKRDVEKIYSPPY